MSRSRSSSGLLVTVTPSQSAFFAGELFSATITLSNPAPITAPPNLHALHSLSHLPPPQTAGPDAPVAWRASQKNVARNRPPSASHIGLAEYATSHLDSDEVPPSPFFGSNSGTFQRQPSYADVAPEREVTYSVEPGGALPTPKSAVFGAFPPLPLPTTNRSVSGAATPVASTSKPTLPTRKGLIGKPLPNAPSQEQRRSAAGGLYGAPRRPGIGKHRRTQSMGFSNPDLVGSMLEDGKTGAGGTSGRRHGKSRLGGSTGSEGLGLGIEERRKSSANPRLPSAIEEEPSSPTTPTAPSLSPLDTASSSPSTSTPSLVISNASPPKNHPYGQQHADQSNALASTFSLANSDGSDYSASESTLDVPGQGFYGVGQNETMDSVVRDDVEDWTRRTSGSQSAGPTSTSFPDPRNRSISYGGNPYAPSSSYARNPFLHPPNTVTVLWSFAHLEGTFEVDDALIKPAEFNEIKRGLFDGFGSGVGGGTLEERRGSVGWRDWLWGEQGRRAASLEERKNSSMREKSIPTFSSPPSILGVDLVLEPGESKSYTLSIRIPADLPPSFRGKAIKFSYHLVVGTNRTAVVPVAAPASRAAAKEALSRTMRVPVRVYNHVGVTGARPFYDLTNPIVYHRDEATTSGVDDPTIVKRARRPSAGRAEFEAYTVTLLESIKSHSPPAGAEEAEHGGTMMEAPPALRPEMRGRHGSFPNDGHVGGAEEEGVGCKAAVEIVSRNSQKVSYDINKDGYMVASLTLVKSAYRLGETVNGSVVINSGEGRVLRVSARLETHELIETSIATKTAPQVRQITRRLHSEHHETTLDSARIGFALAIPSGATPDFATSGVKLQWSVRLSFLVIPPSPDSPLSKPPPNDSHRTPSEGSSPQRHGRSKSFAYGFEPAVPLTLPAAPTILPTGATHLMPVLGSLDTSTNCTSYRAVPDLGFVPILFSSAAPDLPSPGPLQRSASGTSHRSSASLSLPRTTLPLQQASVVLVPAKIETVECSIPIKVYPGNTPFKPTITVFDA